jgi:hypothetical protein
MHLVPEKLQRSTDQIRKQKRTKITDMGKVIHRRTTAVHTHAIAVHRLKNLSGTGERIKESDFHLHISIRETSLKHN